MSVTPRHVEDDRGGRRAADRHQDAALAGVLGEVGNDEDVVGEAGLPDDVELVVEPVAGLFGVSGIAPGEPFGAEAGEVLVCGQASRDIGVGEADCCRTRGRGRTSRRSARCCRSLPGARGRAPASRPRTSGSSRRGPRTSSCGLPAARWRSCRCRAGCPGTGRPRSGRSGDRSWPRRECRSLRRGGGAPCSAVRAP